eukprot:c9458_g1_i1.p1 GENE.c9458_g1_i1~~c9458_g1_i1.p1  ORF type:complete len:431 (-),score=105.35 c9458_g1_i1:71-1291(-)
MTKFKPILKKKSDQKEPASEPESSPSMSPPKQPKVDTKKESSSMKRKTSPVKVEPPPAKKAAPKGTAPKKSKSKKVDSDDEDFAQLLDEDNKDDEPVGDNEQAEKPRTRVRPPKRQSSAKANVVSNSSPAPLDNTTLCVYISNHAKSALKMLRDVPFCPGALEPLTNLDPEVVNGFVHSIHPKWQAFDSKGGMWLASDGISNDDSCTPIGSIAFVLWTPNDDESDADADADADAGEGDAAKNLNVGGEKRSLCGFLSGRLCVDLEGVEGPFGNCWWLENAVSLKSRGNSHMKAFFEKIYHWLFETAHAANIYLQFEKDNFVKVATFKAFASELGGDRGGQFEDITVAIEELGDDEVSEVTHLFFSSTRWSLDPLSLPTKPAKSNTVSPKPKQLDVSSDDPDSDSSI